MSAAPRAGEPAPPFELPDAYGNTVSLESLRGKPLILFFFPKASTPG